MKTKFKIAIVLLVALLISSCSKDFSSYKKIQEQKAGGYTVAILSSSGDIKKGSGNFLLEFHKGSSGELVKVNNLNVSAVMLMAGSPMSGEVSASETGTAGMYEIKYNLSMVGSYKVDISFDNGLKAQFILPVN